MTLRVFLILAVAALSFSVAQSAPAADKYGALALAPTDWAWWRGPNRDGVAAADQTPPLEWSAKKTFSGKRRCPAVAMARPRS